jgi:cytoskeleton protein RodZ
MATMEPNNDKAMTDERLGADAPGALLRAAREQRGLSRQQLAAEVKLLAGQIAALEEGRFDRLAEPVFVRAYLRSLARALRTDETALLAAYERVAPHARPATGSSLTVPVDRPRRPILLERASSARRHWGVAAAALVVAGLWGWNQNARQPDIALSLMPDHAGSQTDPALGGIDDVMASNAQSRLLDSVELLPVTTNAATATLAASAGSAPVASVPAADSGVIRQQLASADSQVVTAEGDQLSLRFSADCWVEIKDRDNRVLVAALKHANERLQLEGKGPFRVLLGFAPGVEMAYNGTLVNIEVPQGNRSARLIVGSS